MTLANVSYVLDMVAKSTVIRGMVVVVLIAVVFTWKQSRP